MNNSDKNNKRRLIRAIEIGTDTTITGSRSDNVPKRTYDDLFMALTLDKAALKETIHKRVDQRLAKGAVFEIKKLLKSGHTFDDPGLNTLGYKQLRDFFEKKTSFEQAVQNWRRAEVDYARRQLVFLKKMTDVHFFDPSFAGFLAKVDALVYKWLYASKS